MSPCGKIADTWDMENDNDLMLNVLKAVEELEKATEPDDKKRAQERVARLYDRGTAKNACFRVAQERGFVKGGGHIRVVLTHEGREELNRLVNARENGQREVERHEREKEQLCISRTALWVSVISLLVSLPTFIAVFLCPFADKLFNVKTDDPFPVVRTVEFLVNKDTSTHDKNKNSESGKCASNTDTDVHDE